MKQDKPKIEYMLDDNPTFSKAAKTLTKASSFIF